MSHDKNLKVGDLLCGCESNQEKKTLLGILLNVPEYYAPDMLYLRSFKVLSPDGTVKVLLSLNYTHVHAL